LAAAALSQGDVCLMNNLSAGAGVELQPFERGRSALLAVPLPVGGGTLAVLELFDRPGGFREDDRQLAAAAAEIGVELLRQALADRQTRRTLFDAVAAALDATNLASSRLWAADAPPPAAVLDTVRASFASTGLSPKESDAMLRLAEAVRALAVRHGPRAVEHCLQMVQSVQDMLEDAAAP
jgi:hypothetical protein